jgi:hypothetical protein
MIKARQKHGYSTAMRERPKTKESPAAFSATGQRTYKGAESSCDYLIGLRQ